MKTAAAPPSNQSHLTTNVANVYRYMGACTAAPMPNAWLGGLFVTVFALSITVQIQHAVQASVRDD